MQLPKSRAVAPDLIFLDSVDSTNLELGRRLGPELPHFTALAAGQQTAGQGGMGRSWVSEPGTSLSLSILLRPRSAERAGLTTSLAAVAAHRALMTLYPQADLGIKWPNDLLLSGKKVSGILASLNGDQIVLGIGVNLKTQAGAPETATALDTIGDLGFDDVLAALLAELRQVFEDSGATDAAAELAYLRANCVTLNSEVRAELPDGSVQFGRATAITDAGLLVIEGEKTIELAAGDVWHLRN